MAVRIFRGFGPVLGVVLALWGAGRGVPSWAQQGAGAGAVQAAAAGPLDINLASPAELRALPGMGDVYVKRVIAGRPYTAKNQLVTRGILPRAAYERIKDGIVAHRPTKVVGEGH